MVLVVPLVLVVNSSGSAGSMVPWFLWFYCAGSTSGSALVVLLRVSWTSDSVLAAGSIGSTGSCGSSGSTGSYWF